VLAMAEVRGAHTAGLEGLDKGAIGGTHTMHGDATPRPW
jgi:hypothetical protein